MTDSEVKDKYNKIITHTLGKNLKCAFDLLCELFGETKKAELVDKKNDLEQNYKYLLQYVISGSKDPEQDKIYNKIRTSLLELADQAYNAIMTSHSNEYPYIQKRNISKIAFPSNADIEKNLSDDDLESIDNLLKDINIETVKPSQDSGEDKDAIIDLVFFRLWLKATYSDRETSLVESIIYNESIHLQYRCLLVSALMLGLFLQFDEKKFGLLIDILTISSGKIQDRAMIAFILSCNIHAQRLTLYPNINKKIEVLIHKPWFSQKFQTCFLLYINGLETEKISKEVKDNIIPDIMKSSTSINENFDLSKLKNIDNLFEENPEWKSISDNGIYDKIQRFTDLQKNGADVFLTTFSSLKNHAFFGHICNWFRPYDTKNSWVKKEFKGKDYKLFDLISLNPTICDSDRYSMLFSLSSVPENYMKMLEDNLKSQEEQIKLIQEENNLTDLKNSDKLDIQLYWQDLYRFFKLHPFKSNFPDPYLQGIEINRLSFVSQLGNEVLENIANTYFNKKFYTAALAIYQQIGEKDNNANILQKIGFCYQKKAFYEEALTYYNKTDLIKPSTWVSKMKAFCLMQLMDYEAALNEYSKISKIEEDNMSLTLYMAQCHIEMKQYEEALPLLYKLEYFSPNNKIYRTIAWCSFLIGKLEHASLYYNKIAPDQRLAKDWLNLGHLALYKGEKSQAIEYYKQAKLLTEDKDKFENLILNDISIIEKSNISKDELPFILDEIRYIE